MCPITKQKIALILSAMRHFAKELEQEGIAVDLRSPRRSGKHGLLLR